MQQRIARAPSFQADWLSDAALDQVCAQYAALTGVRLTSPRKRNLVAAAYRTTGPTFLELVKARFTETGTEMNLLIDLRDGWTPSVPRQVEVPQPAGHDGQGDAAPLDCGCDPSVLLPGLVYCAAHRPRFSPTSNRRHDRRSSNPGALRFFPDASPEPPAR